MRVLRGFRFAMLGMTALLPACRTARPMSPAGPPVQTTVDVHIQDDCTLADPSQEVVELDYYAPTHGPFNTQVRWIVDKGPDDTAVISAKSADYQGNGNPDRGRKIRDMLSGSFVIGPGKSEALSARPRYPPPFLGDKSVVWFYSIDIVRPDRAGCHVDPGLCYRTADGTWICSR